MSAIDSTDKIRSDIEGLLEDREALVALRKVIDQHRVDVHNGGARFRHGFQTSETDEEVIARLATTQTVVSEFVVDETGLPLGRILWSASGCRYIVQTDDARGRAYAKGFWNGVSYKEGRAGAVIGTPAYDRNGAKVDSDSWGSGGVQSFHAAPERPPTTVTCITGAGGPTSTPKPIRLHAGQTWRHPDGGETCLTYLGPSRGVGQYGFGGFTMDIGPDWTVIDARGNVLIAGPGFTG